MKIIGIIAEYNPFHLGHKFHLDQSKSKNEDCVTVSIMSGNFVQRGEPALIDKWTRAEIAVKNGIDLVIELPQIYAMSSAEQFAFGAINILNKTKVIDSIYFGSECDDLKSLNKIADFLVHENPQYKLIIKSNLDKGLPFFKAREVALKTILDDIDISSIINNSNNILAIEYLKALIKLNSNIVPHSIKRVGSLYNDKSIENVFPSASAIRNYLKNNNSLDILANSLTNKTFSELSLLKNSNYDFTFCENSFEKLKYKIVTEGFKLEKLYGIKEGLHNKIQKEILNSSSLDDLILKIKSKRYTYSYISRLLMSFYIGYENYNVENILCDKDYIRPLAFNKKGIEILKKIKEKNNIKIINKIPKHIENKKLLLDITATKAYSQINSSISPLEDYFKSPIFLK